MDGDDYRDRFVVVRMDVDDLAFFAVAIQQRQLIAASLVVHFTESAFGLDHILDPPVPHVALVASV